MITYPIYRKYKNGMEFHKLISDTELISVFKTKYGFRLMLSSNGMIMQDVTGDDVAMPSNKEEFEKVYNQAQTAFTWANNIQ